MTYTVKISVTIIIHNYIYILISQINYAQLFTGKRYVSLHIYLLKSKLKFEMNANISFTHLSFLGSQETVDTMLNTTPTKYQSHGNRVPIFELSTNFFYNNKYKPRCILLCILIQSFRIISELIVLVI